MSAKDGDEVNSGLLNESRVVEEPLTAQAAERIRHESQKMMERLSHFWLPRAGSFVNLHHIIMSERKTPPPPPRRARHAIVRRFTIALSALAR